MSKAKMSTSEWSTITAEEFIDAAEKFVTVSDRICDGWTFYKDNKDIHKSYIKKETFLESPDKTYQSLLKAEYVIFYNLSYGVPAFSFNVWNSSGVLLTLENIRNMSFVKINKEDFYSVITQQEHPVLFRPFFIMHPCHTETLLSMFKNRSKNIIVTFLSLIIPLIRFSLPLEYGL